MSRPPNGSKILAVFGQSNGYGYADPPSATPQPYRGKVWNCAWRRGTYDDTRCDWTNPAREPIHTRKRKGHGSALYMASKLIELGKAETISIIPCGHGGGLAKWLPGAELWNKSMQRIARAEPYGPMTWMLWAPGGADATTLADANAVAGRMATIDAALKERWPDLVIALYRMAPKPPKSNLVGWDIVRDTQAAFAAERSHVHLIEVEGKPLQSDRRHMTGAGYRIAGYEAAEAMP